MKTYMLMRRLICSLRAHFVNVKIAGLSKNGRRSDSVLSAALAFAEKSLSANRDLAAIGQLDGLGSALGRSVLAGNASHGYGLPDICGKVGPNRSGSLHRDGGSALEDPAGYFAIGILGFYPKIRVGILPLELRKRAADVDYLAPVILGLKSVMRKDRQHVDDEGNRLQ